MDKVIIFGMGKMLKWHYQEIKEKVENCKIRFLLNHM